MPEKPCQWCGTPIPSGWSDHRCPEMEQAMADLKAAAGVDDDPEQIDGSPRYPDGSSVADLVAEAEAGDASDHG